jgi:hypothetical protein
MLLSCQFGVGKRKRVGGSPPHRPHRNFGSVAAWAGRSLLRHLSAAGADRPARSRYSTPLARRRSAVAPVWRSLISG